MATTTAGGSVKITPPDSLIALFGLIILVVKFCVTILTLSIICGFGIISTECLYYKADLLKTNVLNMPDYYYSSSIYMALCVYGVVHYVKDTIAKSLISFMSDIDVKAIEIKDEEPKKQN